jgi:hypothetical protein
MIVCGDFQINCQKIPIWHPHVLEVKKDTAHTVFANPTVKIEIVASNPLLNLGTHLSTPHKDATMETLCYPEGLDVKNESYIPDGLCCLWGCHFGQHWIHLGL